MSCESQSLFIKDPDAKLDYSVNWAEYLQTGETIDETSSTWEVVGANATDLSLSRQQLVGAVASVVVSGGVAGQTYQLKNKVTILPNNVDDVRRLLIVCKNRIE